MVLRGITDQTPVFREGDIGRCCAVSFVVRDDLDTIVLPDTNTSTKKDKENPKKRWMKRTYEKVVPKSMSMTCDDAISHYRHEYNGLVFRWMY